jgi:TonB-dependent receptor
MSHRKTLLVASIIAGLCMYGSVQAQDTSASAQAEKPVLTQKERAAQLKAQLMEEITVTGIRASQQKSVETKRSADAIVDAITAEDIGKFPDTNVAESLSHIPGVTIDRLFGQGDRVSINGVDPSLNMTLLNGQPVASLPFLYGAQPNRGFDFTMLPSQIVGRLEVYKSPEARLPEGSIGGTIILHTREPLDLKANTLGASVGYAYNDQASKGEPNVGAVYSWKNQDNTFGVALSGEHFEEDIDRQGIEVFSYNKMSDWAPRSPAIATAIANGTLSPDDQAPSEINAAWFQQKRERNSATVGLQFRPNDRVDVAFNTLYVKENFDNWNQSLYPIPTFTPQNIDSVYKDANGIVAGHVCGNDSPTCGGIANSILDSNIRRSEVTTKDFDLKGKYRGDGWDLTGQIGYTKADNPTSSQTFIEPVYGGGYSWNLSNGVNFDSPQAARDPANWSTAPADGGFAGNFGQIPSNSKEKYAQLDFGKDFDGFINQVLVGVRYNDHTESQLQHVFQGVNTGTLAQIGTSGYTDLFDGNLGDSDFAHHIQPSEGAQKDWVMNSPLNIDDPGSFLNGTYKVNQKTTAGYLQANYAVSQIRGNLGVRYVHNKTAGSGYTYAGAPNVDTADFVTTTGTQGTWLPAFNIAYDATQDITLRFAASKVLSWPAYNMLVGNLFLNDTVLTGTGGNAKLKPYKATNVDGSAEFYFSNDGVAAIAVFYKKIDNYVLSLAAPETQFNSTTGQFATYSITRPTNAGKGKIKGFNLNLQQPFGDTGFGFSGNYTYADGYSDEGGPLPFNSKNSYNLSPYYDKDAFTARVTYNRRSKYFAGGYVAGAPPAYVDNFATVDASIGYKFTPNFALNIDALNLTNETYFQYYTSKEFVAAKYKNGRRYMASLRYTL